MRPRARYTALLLFLLPHFGAPLAVNVIDTSKSPSVARSEPRNVISTAHSTTSTSIAAVRLARAEVGTKDAPVDGLDGKPHSGPFVDGLAELAKGKAKEAVEASGGKKSTKLEEDGVMNDKNRQLPKKGTTGVEGGVSEKERDRKASEAVPGNKPLKKPDPPKEPIPAPNEKVSGLEKADSAGKKAITENIIGTDAEKPRGAAGIGKPGDLPKTPHDTYIPDPVGRAKEAVHDVTASTSLKDSSLKKVPDLHEIIPWDALFGSFSSIAATEIGDKTFIVAALMAMRYPRFQVFTAAFSALFLMTILSAITGHAVGSLISKRWAAVLAAILFLVFGAKSLQEGLAMSPDQGVNEEIREVQAELEEKEVDMARHADGKRRDSSVSAFVLESGRAPRRSRSHSRLAVPHRSPSSSRSPSPEPRSIASTLSGIKNLFSLLLSPSWVETFCMTFIGELGDRSQIATVAMAAGQEYFWVMVGATLGHFVCTGVAVLGGSVLAGRVSMRKVTLVGGAIFIAFGLFTLFEARQFWT